jgi:hypothetical protein
MGSAVGFSELEAEDLIAQLKASAEGSLTASTSPVRVRSMTSGGKINVIAAPTSQRPPATSTSQGNHERSCSRSVMARQTVAGGSGR